MARHAVAGPAAERGVWLREMFARKGAHLLAQVITAIEAQGASVSARSVGTYLAGGAIGRQETLAAIARAIGTDEQTVRKGPWRPPASPPGPEGAPGGPLGLAERCARLRERMRDLAADLLNLSRELPPGEEERGGTLRRPDENTNAGGA